MEFFALLIFVLVWILYMRGLSFAISPPKNFNRLKLHALALCGLVAVSVATALDTALVEDMVPRTSVDPSAPFVGSDYVLVRGMPEFFIVSDSVRVEHPPSFPQLAANYLHDVFFFFCGFSGLALLVAFAAFVANRLLRR